MANFFSKSTILSIKIKQRDLLSDSKNVSNLIAYSELLRTTECSVHYRGSTAPSVLAGQKGDMKVYKLTIQTFCIFDKILSTCTNNIYSTNLTKTRNLPRAIY